ncbi:MAG: type IV secretory system conjugative DNA transfer family protein, partial [Oscillospiraceae bacterium]|nr:type IV secretory system conjugative DNA transfer family protein [Oscillospiraceae bacterium]
TYTVQSGSISRSKGENSQSLQMAERALMTPDELKSIPKGEFVVMKTGSHPMRTRLRLFMDWGITFGEPYQTPEHGQRKVYYAGREELENAIVQRFLIPPEQKETDRSPQRERSGQKNSRQIQQEGQTGQPLATFPRKQDTSSGDADRR